MPNDLIRGLSDDVVERIDSEAAALGPSCNEYLRRKLEDETLRAQPASADEVDWDRFAEVFAHLADATIMEAAWQ